MGIPRHEEILFRSGTMAGLSDGELLRRFLDRRDLAADVAFEAIVARHGPMVLAACRRQLRNPEDAADAFQATFLILARKAGSIRDDGSLGGWLHRVARHASGRARHRSALRGESERVAGLEADRPADPAPAKAERDELREVIDEELGRLPGPFRAPLVLCYLEGLTHDEAAEQLRCSVGTVRSRLARGRDRLRARLIRRGVAPASLLAGSLFSRVASAGMPATLLDRTVKAASRIATGHAVATGSVAAYSLMEGCVRTMLLKEIRAIGMVLALAGASGLGIARLAASSPKVPGPPAKTARAAAQVPDPAEFPGRWEDLKGDWDVVSVEDSGQRLGAREAGFDECTIRAPEVAPTTSTGKVGWLILFLDGNLYDQWSVERLDPTSSPKALALTSRQPDLRSGNRNSFFHHSGIYRRIGDELVVCLSPGNSLVGPPTPNAFASDPQAGTILVTFKRRPADDKRELRRRSIQGTWKVVSVEPAGTGSTDPAPGQTWTIGADSIIRADGDRPSKTLSYRRPNGGLVIEDPTAGTLLALLRAAGRGNLLRICYGKARPRMLQADARLGEVFVELRRLTDPPASANVERTDPPASAPK